MTGAEWRPPYAHLPGRNPRHDEALFDWIRAGEDPAELAWRLGIAFLREGFFWECHEVLEPLWMACPPNSAEAEALRGVIQLANAALKARMGAGRAALRLLKMAERHLSEAIRRGADPRLHPPEDVVEGVQAQILAL